MLLSRLSKRAKQGEAAEITELASVAPLRGRLLLFPHVCPHAGNPVVDVPKCFLRGELRWEPAVAASTASTASTPRGKDRRDDEGS